MAQKRFPLTSNVLLEAIQLGETEMLVFPEVKLLTLTLFSSFQMVCSVVFGVVGVPTFYSCSHALTADSSVGVRWILTKV